MILHLKKDSHLTDWTTSKRFSWQAGQHEVNDVLAKSLLQTYPELFEEVPVQEGVSLAPNTNPQTPAQQASPANSAFTCDVCGKEVKNQLALIGHKRTHSRGITTSDLMHP